MDIVSIYSASISVYPLLYTILYTVWSCSLFVYCTLILCNYILILCPIIFGSGPLQNPVGPGRYDVHKADVKAYVNGHESVFRSTIQRNDPKYETTLKFALRQFLALFTYVTVFRCNDQATFLNKLIIAWMLILLILCSSTCVHVQGTIEITRRAELDPRRSARPHKRRRGAQGYLDGFLSFALLAIRYT